MSGYLSERSEIIIYKRYLHSSVLCIIVHNSQDTEQPTCPSVNEQIERMSARTHTQWNSIQPLKKYTKRTLSYAITWVNFEEIMPNAIGQP